MMTYFRKEMFAAIVLSMIPTAAFAHALLQKAEPPVGGTVSASPAEIRIDFSEGVEPAFSGITLATSGGAAVPVGKAAVDPQNAGCHGGEGRQEAHAGHLQGQLARHRRRYAPDRGQLHIYRAMKALTPIYSRRRTT